MHLQFRQADSLQQLEQILDLQQNNLAGKLSNEEKEKEGFLTVEHGLDLLQRMNNVCGHIIATEAELVVGYALCMDPCFSDEIPVLQPMFAQLAKTMPAEYNYMVMGQVCVAKAYRGKGIFRGLYSHMKQMLKLRYDGIITEVDSSNLRSLSAHKAIGFINIGTYSSGGQDWQLLNLPI